MVYTDWQYYVDVYLGNSISQEDFLRLALRASEWIDDITHGRAKAYYETVDAGPVANAACAVTEVISRFEGLRRAGSKDGARVVTSENNDGFAQTFAAPVDPDSKDGQSAFDVQMYAAAAKYLRRTGMLFVGVDMR